MTTESSRASSRQLLRASSALGALVVLCLCCVIQLRAGEKSAKLKDYAVVKGTVWGADNRPVYGVRIIVRRADAKKASWDRITDHNGEFAVRVPPGTGDYVVIADVKVPKGEPQPQAKAHVEGNEIIEVGLHIK